MTSQAFTRKWFWLLACVLLTCTACDNTTDPLISDAYSAPKATIDRFSDAAGTLFRRSTNAELPAAGEPINFDESPFLTQALGPEGHIVKYYNFDVMPRDPAPLYVFFRQGDNVPLEKQPHIVDVIPGDKGYSDFWQVHKVMVPADYTINSATSLAEIKEAGYPIKATPKIVNCPIVPKGSTASYRYRDDADPGLHHGWYKGKVIYYFIFQEHPLRLTPYGGMPVSDLYVTFNANPDSKNGGFASGFKTEPDDRSQTHNVTATIPADAAYSPLRLVTIYDNADFGDVSDLSSAQEAHILAPHTALVNHPMVK